MANYIPTANICLKSSLPKNIIAADWIPVMTHTANPTQIFSTQKRKNMQL